MLFRSVLKGVIRGTPMTSIPSFPTLNSEQSWVIVGRNGYGTYDDAIKGLFGILRNNEFRPQQDSFGGINPRRSSPIIAQVRRIGKDNYYPILTAILSTPDTKGKINPTILGRFMTVAQKEFNGVTVWGGW